MKRALILSGEGRYADPWHPFALTSDRLAQLLISQGAEVEVSGDVDARMASLPTDPPDLLVVNIGDPALNFPGEPAPSAEARGRGGLLAYLASGRSLLGAHAAITSLRGVPEWPSILGGLWVRGQSFHPDYAPFSVTVERSDITDDLADFEVEDELYSNLALEPDNAVVASHGDIPLVWRRTFGAAGARVVYDALGHDGAAYESAGHRALLRRCITWLLE